MNDTMTYENELQALRELQEWASKWGAMISGSEYGLVIGFRNSPTTYTVFRIRYDERGMHCPKITMKREVTL